MGYFTVPIGEPFEEPFLVPGVKLFSKNAPVHFSSAYITRLEINQMSGSQNQFQPCFVSGHAVIQYLSLPRQSHEGLSSGKCEIEP
jgi:hypothetical protein